MKILNEIKKEDDLYFNGVFWVIANSYEDILNGNFTIKSVKYLVDFNGNEVDKTSKGSKTHRVVWDNYNNKPYTYYPRGRVNIYKGNVYINLNSKINLPLVINQIISEFDLHNFDNIKILDIDNMQPGNHYDFELE